MHFNKILFYIETINHLETKNMLFVESLSIVENYATAWNKLGKNI